MDDEFKEILKLVSKQDLEAAGSQLTLFQAHALLQYLKKIKNGEEKFLPLLVGMSQGLFYELLETVNKTEWQILKATSVTEALQHKLTLLLHDLKEEVEALMEVCEQIRLTIEKIQLDNISKIEILAIKDQIDSIDHLIERRTFMVNNALTLAWNSNRLDLIDGLGELKDAYLRASYNLIGHAKEQNSVSSGLYKNLDDRLDQVYSIKEGTPNRLLLFQDHEPAREALTSFGIFYIEDYWEFGLLPSLSTLKEFKNVIHNASSEEKVLYLEGLLTQVEVMLEKLGLVDVKSLKNAGIFSKEMLKDYIKARKS